MHRQALYRGLKKLEKPLILDSQEIEEALALVSCARRTLPTHDPDYPQKLSALSELIDNLRQFDMERVYPCIEAQSRDLCQLFFRFQR